MGLTRFLDNLLNNNVVILILYPSSRLFNKRLNTRSEPGTWLDTMTTDMVPASDTLHLRMEKEICQQVQKSNMDHGGNLYKEERKQGKP